MIKVLVVDDSPLIRRILGRILTAEGDFEVAFARDGTEALAMIPELAPDVVTLDVQMPGMDGLACLDRIMLEHPCRVVMVSSLTGEGAATTVEALALGAVDFVPKPDGAVTLSIDTLAPRLVETLRAAAGARLPAARRLRERVRLRSGLDPKTLDPGTKAPRRPSIRHPGEAAGRDGIAGHRPLASGPRPDRPRAAPATAALHPPLHLSLPRSEGIVLVGTSTGGPPALEALLTPLPADFPWPVVVAQHMPAAFTGPLARRLDTLCALTVVEVTRPMPLRPGHVYIGRGDADVILGSRSAGPVVMAAPSAAAYRWHPSVDRLVESALDLFEAGRLVGILMTGMGSDGALSMTRLRSQGGRTIAEAKETAIVWGMPGELVRAGGAAIVSPLDEIAARVVVMAAQSCAAQR